MFVLKNWKYFFFLPFLYFYYFYLLSCPQPCIIYTTASDVPYCDVNTVAEIVWFSLLHLQNHSGQLGLKHLLSSLLRKPFVVHDCCVTPQRIIPGGTLHVECLVWNPLLGKAQPSWGCGGERGPRQVALTSEPC